VRYALSTPEVEAEVVMVAACDHERRIGIVHPTH
jgi:hypothetical protein